MGVVALRAVELSNIVHVTLGYHESLVFSVLHSWGKHFNFTRENRKLEYKPGLGRCKFARSWVPVMFLSLGITGIHDLLTSKGTSW